jgi:hypothetical protein
MPSLWLTVPVAKQSHDRDSGKHEPYSVEKKFGHPGSVRHSQSYLCCPSNPLRLVSTYPRIVARKAHGVANRNSGMCINSRRTVNEMLADVESGPICGDCAVKRDARQYGALLK